MNALRSGIRALALACAWWQLSCEPRQLTVDSPVGDEAAEEEWDRLRGEEAQRARQYLGAHWPVSAALFARELRALADSGPLGRWARRVAARAVREAAREYPDLLRAYGVQAGTVVVHAFGRGWREQPRVLLVVQHVAD